MFLAGFGLFGAMFLLPLYFQELNGASLGAGGIVDGHDVLATGLILISQGLGTLLSRAALGRLIDRVGPRWIALSCFLLTAIATIPFAFAGPDTSIWWLMAVLFIRGLGLGGAILPLMAHAFSGLEQHEVPDASIVTRIFQQLGGSFGTGVLATVLAGGVAGATTLGDVAGGFQDAFWWAVGFTGVAVVLSLLLPATQPRAAEIVEGEVAAAEA
jgi:MFS family permease